MVAAQSKRCPACETVKDASAFNRQSSSKDGLGGYCRLCAKQKLDAWREQNPEKVLEVAKRRTVEGRSAKHQARYRESHPERVKAYTAAIYAASQGQIRKRLADWAAANPERKRAAKTAWRKANLESVRASGARNRAMRLKAPGTHTAEEIQELYRKQKGCCAVCKTKVGDKYEVDHVVALASGGSNDILNIQILCRPCNRRKSAKDPVRFMQERGFLI